MAAKQEQALAPTTVSHADPNGGPPPHQPFQHQAHPPNYHQGQVVYQQPYGHLPHYQQQAPPVWNQPPQATVHYVQYAPPHDGFQDMKVPPSYTHYGTVHYAQPTLHNQTMENGDMMMRVPQPTQLPQQYVPNPQWYQSGQQSQGQFINYAPPFNVTNDPPYHPNHQMNHAAGVRRDDYQGGNDTSSANYMQFVPFVAPIGVMESQAHASASYTANWVSSTSSIPPEMKDEPESDNISQYDCQRPTSQMNGDNWTDHEDHMSPSSMHCTSFNLPPPPPPRPMPYAEKDKSTSQSTTKTAKSVKGDRPEEKRELTFDERLEKARMQKTRAENKGVNGESSANPSGMAQGSNTAISSTSVQTPRTYGQRREYTGYFKPENGGGYNNNSNNYNMNSRGRGGAGGHYNGNNGQNEVSDYFQPPNHQQQPLPQQLNQYYQHQPPRYEQRGNGGNAIEERDINTKRENNYNTNRFDNNQHNSTYNQKPQAPRETGPEFYRQPGYRGGRGGGRGGYRGGYQQGQQGQQSASVQQTSQPTMDPSHYAGAPQVMSSQMLATINAFQNTNIGNYPPRVPLLPGPFGMARHPPLHQDVKFHNTWLDAASCPLPLAAVMTMDTRFGRIPYNGGIPYRGRREGGFGGYRGGYRGRGGGYTNPRYLGKTSETPAAVTPPEVPTTNAVTEQEPSAVQSEDQNQTEVKIEVEKTSEPELGEKPLESKPESAISIDHKDEDAENEDKDAEKGAEKTAEKEDAT